MVLGVSILRHIRDMHMDMLNFCQDVYTKKKKKKKKGKKWFVVFAIQMEPFRYSIYHFQVSPSSFINT